MSLNSQLPVGDPVASQPAVAAAAVPGQGRGAANVAWLPLRNRNIGILSGDLRHAETRSLQQVVTALGARVALVRSELGEASTRKDLLHTARVLGRLYDAILCVELPQGVVDKLREAAGVPVISDEAGRWGALPSNELPAADAARALLLAQLASL